MRVSKFPWPRGFFGASFCAMNIPATEHARRKLVSIFSFASTLLCLIGFAGLSCAADKAASDKAPVTKSPPKSASSESNEAWKSYFDGKTLKGWKVTDFAGHGEVSVKDGTIVLEMGQMTGITWTNDLPTMNYEISLEAMRVDGGDFFCGLTFPVGKDPCSLIVGGWGGGVVGLSSLDSQDAANNETTTYMNFKSGQWYLIRLRVTEGKIQAWIDSDIMVDADTKARAISIRMEVEESKPLGIASYSTKAALKNIKIRQLPK